jgi:hypothetical protein
MYCIGRDSNMKQDIVKKTTFVDVLGIGHTCHTDTRNTTREEGRQPLGIDRPFELRGESGLI